MAQRLLAGLRVVDLGGEPSARAPRGCSATSAPTVVRVVPPGRRRARAATSRGRGTRASRSSRSRPTTPTLDALLADGRRRVRHARRRRHAPARPGARAGRGVGEHHAVRARRTARVVARVRPRRDGREREHVRAPAIPIARRCAAPSRPAYAHTGGEAAFAALTALWSGVAAARRRLDAGGRARREHGRARELPEDRATAAAGGARTSAAPARSGPTLDGFVSFGLRGGKARVASLETLTKLVVADGIPADALTSQDWNTFNQNTATDEELDAIATAVAEYFARHTMQELYDIACETNLMLAPANSPQEIYASAQLASRDFFGPVGDVERFPRSFVVVRSADGEAAPVRPARRRHRPARRRAYPRRRAPDRPRAPKAWDGVQHPRVRVGRGRADRDALLRRARRDRAAHRVEDPARLPARDGARGPRQPARPRGRADVRRAQRRQAQPHAQPEAARRRSSSCAGSSSSGPTRSPRTSRRGR